MSMRDHVHVCLLLAKVNKKRIPFSSTTLLVIMTSLVI